MASAAPLNPGDIETGNATALAAAGIVLPPEPELKGPLKPVQETTPRERIAGAVAFVAIITSLVAMILEGGAIVVVAGILSMILGPYAYFQQTRLTDIAMLKETAAVVQAEVDKLKAENDRLTKNVDELEHTIDDLQDVEQALDVISNTQGQSVTALEKQVQENKDILSKMKKSTKGRVIQNLISIIYRGDENLDDVIGDKEATNVINNLNKIAGLTIHEDRLRKAITGKSVESVIEVVKNLLRDDVPDEERIFVVKE
jgi:FtsZ-binding cell division protein ZapB